MTAIATWCVGAVGLPGAGAGAGFGRRESQGFDYRVEYAGGGAMTFGCKPGQYAEVHLDSGANPAFDFRKLGICPALEAEYRGFKIDDRLLEGIWIKARQWPWTSFLRGGCEL